MENAETRADSGLTPSRLNSMGVQETGIVHQAFVRGGSADTICGQCADGDRMTLTGDVNCPNCLQPK